MANLRIVDAAALEAEVAGPGDDNDASTRLLAYIMAGSDPEAIIQRAIHGLGLIPEIARVELATSPSADPRGTVDIPCGSAPTAPRFLRAYLQRPSSPMDRRRVLDLLGLVSRVHARELEIKRLHDEAHTDPLTGLCNRRAFEPIIDQALARAQRTGEDVAMMLCDVDNFKSINDTHGHARGDRALRAVASAIRTVLRPTDLASRWGGDEFAILLASCDAGGARAVASRLRHELFSPEWKRAITLSIGITDAHGLPRGPLTVWQARETFFRAADEAVYMAKEAGRDTYVCHPSCYRIHEVGDSDVTRPIRLECGS